MFKTVLSLGFPSLGYGRTLQYPVKEKTEIAYLLTDFLQSSAYGVKRVFMSRVHFSEHRSGERPFARWQLGFMEEEGGTVSFRSLQGIYLESTLTPAAVCGGLWRLYLTLPEIWMYIKV